MNSNCPPLQVLVQNSFISIDEKPGLIAGTLISVRALMNQALQFSVLLDTGALYTGLPINAITSNPTDMLSINDAQAYDCVGSEIQVICFDILRYMLCTVKTFKGEILKGTYLFTIDFLDNNGLGRHPEQWKQFHIIDTESGWVAYPQYRIIFQDDAFCPNKDKPATYKHNTAVHVAECWEGEDNESF